MTQSPWGQSEDGKMPIRTPIWVGHMGKHLRREDVVTHRLRSPKSEYSSRILQLATCTKGQDTKEDNRDVQVKKRENIWVKQQSPPHSMHCTNSTGRINKEITPEQ